MNSLNTINIYCGDYSQFCKILPDLAKVAVVPNCNYDMGYVVFEKALIFFRETKSVNIFTNNDLWYYAARVVAVERYNSAEFCFVLFQRYNNIPRLLPIDSKGNVANDTIRCAEFYTGIDNALSAISHVLCR